MSTSGDGLTSTDAVLAGHTVVDAHEELEHLLQSVQAEEKASLAAQQKQHVVSDAAMRDRLLRGKAKKSRAIIDNAFKLVQRVEEKAMEEALAQNERMRQKLAKGKRRRSAVTQGGSAQPGSQQSQHQHDGVVAAALLSIDSPPPGLLPSSLHDALAMSAAHQLDLSSPEGRQIFATLLEQICHEQAAAGQQEEEPTRQLTADEQELLTKLQKGRSSAQQDVLALAFQHPLLCQALMEEALLALDSAQRPGSATDEAAAAAAATFATLRKLFLGAIRKLPPSSLIEHLASGLPLINSGYLDLNEPLKQQTAETALHIAAKHGKQAVVAWLAAHGRIDIDRKTAAGQTALHLAVAGSVAADDDREATAVAEGCRQTVRALLQGGASVDAEDGSGESVAAMAQRLGVPLEAGEAVSAILEDVARVEGRKAGQERQQEELMLRKLQAGKASKSQRLMASAMQEAERHAAVAQSEEERQRQLMQERLQRGKKRAAAASAAPVDEPRWLQELLLSLLSEATKQSILSAMEATHDAGDGVDLLLLARCKGLTVEEAVMLVGGEATFGSGEMERLHDELQRLQPGDEVDRVGLQRVLQLMAVNHAMYAEVLAVLQTAQDAQQSSLLFLNGGAALPFDDVNAALTSAFPTSFTPVLPPPLLAAVSASLSAYISRLLPRELEAPSASSVAAGEVQWPQLQEAGVDTELMLAALTMSVDDFSLLTMARSKGMEEEEARLESLAAERQAAGSGWTADESAEVERLRLIYREGRTAREEISSAVRHWRQHGDVKEAVDADSGLSNISGVKEAMLVQLQERAAQHLGLSAEEVRGMSAEDVKAELKRSGVDADILQEMQRLSEAEVGQYLAQQRAEKEAEAAMIGRMLKGKRLTEAKRAELQAREQQLLDAGRMYQDMLSSLVSGERRQGQKLSQEEAAAHQRMLDKMEEKRRRRQQAQQDADTGLSTAGHVPDLMVEQLQEMAAAHLGRSADELQQMTAEQLQAELKRRGVHAGILQEMQRLTEAEVGQYLARQKAESEAEAAMIGRMLKGRGLTAGKRAELEQRRQVLEDAARLYDDMFSSLVAGEQKQGEQRTKEEEAAHQAMLAKLADKKRRKEQQTQDADTGLALSTGLQPYLVAQLQELAAEHLGLSPDSIAALTPQQLQEQLQRAGVAVDVMDELKRLSEAEVGQYLAQQRAEAEAEAAMIRKMLRGKGLTEAKRAELQQREQALLAAGRLYSDMLSSLVAGERRQTQYLSQEEQAAHQRLLDKLEEKRRKREEREKDVDTGLSRLQPVDQATLPVLQALAAEHVGLSLQQLQSLTEEEVRQQLVRKGVDVDILQELQRLSEAEVGHYLAQQKAHNDAEAAMIRKMLRGKGLSDGKRAELLARERLLTDASRLYDDMLLSLIAGQQRHGSQRGKEEEAAHRRMLDKMEEKRRRRQQQDGQPAIADKPAVLSALLDTAASLLGLSAQQLSALSADELQAELSKAGADVDLMELLRGLTEAEAAKALYARRMRDEAELRLLRKLLAGKAGKGMTAEEREQLQARERQLQDKLDLYDGLLSSLLKEEEKRLSSMSREERAAFERMQAKLATGKSRPRQPRQPALDACDPEQQLRHNPLLLHLVAPIAASHLSLSPEQLSTMTVAQVQAELAKAGVLFDLQDLLSQLMDSEAARWLQAQREALEAERQMVQRLLAGKGRKLTEQERAALQLREAELGSVLAGFDDMMQRLLEEERRRRGLMSEEERLAYERMLDKLRARKGKQPDSVTGDTRVGDSPVLMDMLTAMAASRLSLSPEQLSAMTVAEVQAALHSAGVQVDILEMLRELTDSEAATWLQAQRMKAEAEADLLRKLLSGKGRKLTQQEKEEAESRLQRLEAEIADYDDLLRRLLEEESKRQRLMSEEERLAYERMMDKLRRGRGRKQQQQPTLTADSLVGSAPVLMDIVAALASTSHLSLSPEQLSAMTVAEVQAELSKAGVDVDLLEMLRGLADSEAAKWLQAQRARLEAEAELLRKLLSGKGRKLTDKEREDAALRLKAVEADIGQYDGLLQRLLDEERRRQAVMDEEQRVAYERMMERLRAGKRRPAAAGPQAGEVTGETVIGDNPLLLDVLSAIAASHLSLSPEQLSGMTVAEVQAELSRAGVDVDILEMLRDLTDSRAARWLQAQRARAQAEADLLRKLLSKGRLSPEQQSEAEQRLDRLTAEIELYDSLLNRLLSEELKRQQMMADEERRAYERMMEKLRNRKKKPTLLNAAELTLETVIGTNPQLLEMLSGLASLHCSTSMEQLAGMTIDALQTSLHLAGVDIDLLEMMQKLTDSEAAKWLFEQSEADGVDDIHRDCYRELLVRLVDEETRQLAVMGTEQEASYHSMLEKLARRKQSTSQIPLSTADGFISFAREIAPRHRSDFRPADHQTELELPSLSLGQSAAGGLLLPVPDSCARAAVAYFIRSGFSALSSHGTWMSGRTGVGAAN